MDDSAEVWKWQVQCWEKGAEELGKFWGSDTSSSPWRVCSGSVMVCAQDFNRLFSRGRGCARKRGRKWNCEIAQSCPTLWDPMNCSLSGSSVHVIFQEWSGLPFPSPDLPNPGIEPRSPALLADPLPSEPPGKRNRVLIQGFPSIIR